jgi:hypothetical protein
VFDPGLPDLLGKTDKNIPTFSITRPFKVYPNWDFWYGNTISSGNPDVTHK